MKALCDACDSVFEVADSAIGTKVACPKCGDIHVVRASVVAGEASPVGKPAGASGSVPAGGSGVTCRAVAEGLPSPDGPEVVVRVVRPATFRARPISASIAWVLAVGGLIAAPALFFTGIGIPAAIGAGLGALAGMIALGVWKVRSYTEAIRITNRRVVDREGLLSKSTSGVLHKDIKNVQVRQSFWQRVWGVGTISISSSADDGIEVMMRNCPRPEEVERLIDLYRR